MRTCNYYECEVTKIDEKSNLRFENLGFNIKHKEVGKGYIKYDCLLTNYNKLRIRDIDSLKITKESRREFKGNMYFIYCDGGVYNYGNDSKHIKLSVTTTIIYKNNKEIFKETNVYEQFLDNNTMEVLALLTGLRYLNKNNDKLDLKNSKVIVSSDSQNLQEYVIRPKIIKAVVKKCTTDKESLYYSELMRELLNELNYYLSFLDIYIGWTKGHVQIRVSSSKETLMNYNCDKLCREAIRKRLKELSMEDYKEEH